MKTRRAAVAAITVAAVAAAGGAAVAATKDDPKSAIINDAAKRLDVTPKALSDALSAAEKAQGATLGVDRGRHGGGPGFGGGGRGPFSFFFGGDAIDAAAKALNLTTDELGTRLRDGKSLADVAKAQSKDLADVKAAVRAALSADLDEAVKDNELTRERADEVLKRFADRFDDFATQAGPAGPGRGFGGPGGRGRGPGFALGFGFGGVRFDLRQEATAAAKALGITRDQLVNRLRDGNSLAAITKDEGKDLADVKAAVRSAFKDGLDAGVKDNKLTQARADEVLKEFDDHFDELAQQTGPRFGGGRGPGFRHP